MIHSLLSGATVWSKEEADDPAKRKQSKRPDEGRLTGRHHSSSHYHRCARVSASRRHDDALIHLAVAVAVAVAAPSPALQ